MCIGESDEKKRKSLSIDKEIAKERHKSYTINMLLLGPGESGKSTVFKQITLLHKGGFKDDERLAQIEIIRDNVRNNLRLLFPDASLADLNRDFVKDLLSRCNECRKEVLRDNGWYFVENALRIVDPSYVPTDEDILR